MAVVLTACTSQGRYTAMRKGLDSINMLNKSYQPFTVADVRPYVQYFDDHGTSNDRVLAYYLMGRAYHDQREAPMALEYYQKATELADTTEAGFDFAQLSKVYGQMADIFYQQNLFRQQMVFIDQAVKNAMKANDYLTAIANYEHKAVAYQRLNETDSALQIYQEVFDLYKKRNYTQEAAISLGGTLLLLIKSGQYEKASQNMQYYETNSGCFNAQGNIEKGREVYYYMKGLLSLKELKFDSAEYWFRKELRDGGDWNNQNAGSNGLAMLYTCPIQQQNTISTAMR